MEKNAVQIVDRITSGHHYISLKNNLYEILIAFTKKDYTFESHL